MQQLRQSLYNEVLQVIGRFNNKLAFPLMGAKREKLLLSAVFLLEAEASIYNKIIGKGARKCEECINELVSLIKSYKVKGLEVTSYDGARLYLWLTCADYIALKQLRDKERQQEKYLDDCSKLVAGGNKFTFGVLFDSLLLLSKSRRQVLTLAKQQSWRDTNKRFYSKKDRVTSIVKNKSAFESGWGVEIALSAIKAHIFSAMQFAKENQMQSLSKVLFQIQKIEVLGEELSQASYKPAEFYCHNKSLMLIKRIDAALDELFVYIYRRKSKVEYGCEQVSKTSDGSFICQRHFHGEGYSLLNTGVSKDDMNASSSFYSLFTVKSYADLISQLKEWFGCIAA